MDDCFYLNINTLWSYFNETPNVQLQAEFNPKRRRVDVSCDGGALLEISDAGKCFLYKLIGLVLCLAKYIKLHPFRGEHIIKTSKDVVV